MLPSWTLLGRGGTPSCYRRRLPAAGIMEASRSDISRLTVPTSPRLSEVLLENRGRLQSEIALALQGVPGSRYSVQHEDVLQGWAFDGVEAMASALRTGTSQPLEDHATHVARQRLELGFQLHHVVQGIVLHRDATLPVVIGAAQDPLQAIEWMNAVNTCGRLILARFSEAFAEEARESERHIAVLHERQRLARELHDSVTQSLYGVTLHAEVATRHLTAGATSKALESLACVRETANDALREMRLLLFELTPPNLAEKGLAHVLAERLAAVEGRTGIKTRLQVSGIDRLPPEIELGLLGIAREALHNAWRHGHPTSVSMKLTRIEGTVTLEVQDDGVGFDLGNQRGKEGLGLGTMNERAAELCGNLTIDTRMDLGTIVRVAVPLDTEAKPSASYRARSREVPRGIG